MFYTVTPSLYDETAHRLSDAIGRRDYFSGSVAFDFGDTECRFTATLLLTRTPVDYPEGTVSVLTDAVPVWWEFHTTTDAGELLNDFDFGELRSRITAL